jgi:hypothetical protein
LRVRELAGRVDRRSLVEVASDLVNISSPTGEEQGVAEYLRGVFESMGLYVMWRAPMGRRVTTKVM